MSRVFFLLRPDVDLPTHSLDGHWATAAHVFRWRTGMITPIQLRLMVQLPSTELESPLGISSEAKI